MRTVSTGELAVAASVPESRGLKVGTLAAMLAAHDDRLSNCVHCGFCLPACPTYVRMGDEADSPRGRLHLMGAVAEGRLDPGSDAFQTHIDRCLGCRACETVCPSGVEYGFLLERAREVASEARRSPLAARALLTMIRHPPLLASWMGPSRALRWSRIPSLLARKAPSWRWLRSTRLAMAMLAASVPWKAPSTGGSPRRSEIGEREPGASKHRQRHQGRVGVLVGCVQQHLFSRVNAATIRVLKAHGWEVVTVTEQGCCGALHAHGGQLQRSREMARKNIRAFRAAEVDWIVSNAAGCGATMKEYHHLLEEADSQTKDDARWFSERVRDISEVIVTPEGEVRRQGGVLPIRVAYDPPCHLLHGQRVEVPPLRLLRSIPGVEVVPVPRGEECCGGAGIYGITHPDLGGRIGEDKVNAVLSTGADVLATGNPGCAMQIGAGLRMRRSPLQIAHPIELLDESFQRGGIYDGRH